MASNRYGVIGASVTQDSQEMWDAFRRSARSRGMNYTRALEQAAAMWLEKNPTRERPEMMENPFA